MTEYGLDVSLVAFRKRAGAVAIGEGERELVLAALLMAAGDWTT